MKADETRDYGPLVGVLTYLRGRQIMDDDWRPRMRSRLVVSSAMFALSISIGHAQDATRPFSSGNLREGCRRFVQNHSSSSLQNAGEEGICAGIVATVLRFGTSMSDRFRFCPPPHGTVAEAMPILVKYLDDNPNSLRHDLRDVANAVFRLTWPCHSS